MDFYQGGIGVAGEVHTGVYLTLPRIGQHQHYYSLIMVSDRIQHQSHRLLKEAEQAITNEDWSTE